MPCSRQSQRPGDGLTTCDKEGVPRSPRLASRRATSNGISVCLRRSHSCHLGSCRQSSRARRLLTLPSQVFLGLCRIPGPSRPRPTASNNQSTALAAIGAEPTSRRETASFARQPDANAHRTRLGRRETDTEKAARDWRRNWNALSPNNVNPARRDWCRST